MSGGFDSDGGGLPAPCPVCGGELAPPAPGAGDARMCLDCGAVHFCCPGCGRVYGKSEIVDKAAPRCDDCGHLFKVPDAPKPAPPPPSPTPSPGPAPAGAPVPPPPCPFPPRAEPRRGAFMHLLTHMFDFHCRCRRGQFWGGLIWLNAMVAVAIVAVEKWLGQTGPLPAFLSIIACAWFAISLAALVAQRLHDLGHSGWWQLAHWLLLMLCMGRVGEPFTLLMLGVAAIPFFLAGAPLPNRWGPPPG